jgi:putative sigma-54 modulation protein
MNVEYTGRQTTVTSKLKQLSEEGLSHIAKIAGETGSAHVILGVDKYRNIAEITFKARIFELVASSEGVDMEAALRGALARLEQQVVRQNQKKTTIKRHPKEDVKVGAADDGGTDVVPDVVADAEAEESTGAEA